MSAASEPFSGQASASPPGPDHDPGAVHRARPRQRRDLHPAAVRALLATRTRRPGGGSTRGCSRAGSGTPTRGSCEGVQRLHSVRRPRSRASKTSTGSSRPLTGFRRRPSAGTCRRSCSSTASASASSRRRSPSATAAHLDYLPEPDIFHDIAGHVPMHTDQAFADALVRFGECAARGGRARRRTSATSTSGCAASTSIIRGDGALLLVHASSSA